MPYEVQGHPSRHDSPCLSKLAADGPATANPLRTVENSPQLPLYPTDVNIVIAPPPLATDCRRDGPGGSH